MSFTANRVGGASLTQTVTVLVAVGLFEVVAVPWDSTMALCADSEEAHGVEGCVVCDEGGGVEEVSLK